MFFKEQFQADTGLNYLNTFKTDPTLILNWIKQKAEATT